MVPKHCGVSTLHVIKLAYYHHHIHILCSCFIANTGAPARFEAVGAGVTIGSVGGMYLLKSFCMS